MFQEAKCAEKQSVLGSKVLQGEKCSRKQTVYRGKVFQGAKCVEEKNCFLHKLWGLHIFLLHTNGCIFHVITIVTTM